MVKDAWDDENTIGPGDGCTNWRIYLKITALYSLNM